MGQKINKTNEKIVIIHIYIKPRNLGKDCFELHRGIHLITEARMWTSYKMPKPWGSISRYVLLSKHKQSCFRKSILSVIYCDVCESMKHIRIWMKYYMSKERKNQAQWTNKERMV